MKTYAMLLILLCLSIQGFAQDILMSKEVKKDSTKVEKVKKATTHLYTAYGLAFGTNNKGAEINSFKSGDWRIGLRHVRKFTGLVGGGFDIAYVKRSYRIKQNANKTFPNLLTHDEEKLILNDLHAELYLRFNYGKSNRMIGKFIDIGGYGGWMYKSVFTAKDDIPGNIPGKTIEMIITHLDYTEKLKYGALLRVGFGRYVFYGDYRLSNIFKGSSTYPELPEITAGVMIGLHK